MQPPITSYIYILSSAVFSLHKRSKEKQQKNIASWTRSISFSLDPPPPYGAYTREEKKIPYANRRVSTVSESVLPLAYIISSRTEEEKSPSPSPSALVSFISASLDVSAQRRMQKRRGEKKLSLDVPSPDPRWMYIYSLAGARVFACIAGDGRRPNLSN